MALLFTGCEEPVRETMEFPIELVLPAEDLYSSEGAPEQRVFGDPGQAELFAKPTYAYIFVVFVNNSVQTITPIITTLAEDNWGDVKYYGSETALTEHYYNYKKTFLIKPVVGADAARVYAAVSNIPLTLKFYDEEDEKVKTLADNLAVLNKESEILSITFSSAGIEQKNLKNIYSSPYNYEVGPKDGEYYYGTVTNLATKVPSVRLVLYHVASKVDIMWNVPTDQQSAVRVVGVQAINLYKGDCKLFKPTENTAAANYTSDATFDLAGNSVGTWWNGRNYFYTIPYHSVGQFPLQVDFTLQNVSPEAENVCHLVAKKTMPAVFTPWMRGMLTVTGPLPAEKTVTMNLDQ